MDRLDELAVLVAIEPLGLRELPFYGTRPKDDQLARLGIDDGFWGPHVEAAGNILHRRHALDRRPSLQILCGSEAELRCPPARGPHHHGLTLELHDGRIPHEHSRQRPQD